MTEIEQLKVRVKQLEKNQENTCAILERILNILERDNRL